KNIFRCYTGGSEPRFKKDSKRTYEKLSRVWLPEVQKDLVSQMDKWQQIAALASGPAITPLRALDIVGWWMGR
ncbi:MAG: DUF6308 family protein, partial [Chloroflexota bacterium]|nr:DUF6308 family protein [Chloroflexota bacterium]